MMIETRPRIAFFGTPEFAVPCLRAIASLEQVELVLVVTQPDRPAGRGNKLQPSPVKLAAQSLAIPVFQPEKLKQEQQALEKLCPNLDLGVVVAFGQILPTSVLKLPRLGCINVHASLLPRWRGAAPIQRALMAGDQHTGVCLMQMERGLDTGPVLFSKVIDITGQDDFRELHDKLAQTGADLLKSHLLEILTGKVQATPQDEAQVEYASKISNEECRINWDQPAEIIQRQIRALSPYPGAFTFLAGRRVKIYKAEVAKALSNSAALACGAVARLDKHTLEIRCARDLLALEEVQMEGKTRLPIREFIKGTSLDNSTVFGA